MDAASPLAGLLVVAIEQAVAAPYCTMRLCDAGARVIKIERASGETARHYDRAVHGGSAYFVWLNRGKESCVLDLKNASDVAVVQRLLAKADVFIQNLAPGAAARLGLSHDDAHAINPRLICLDIVGYGQETDYASMKAYDMLVQAESGLCAVTGTPDTPSKVGVSAADLSTGMNAHAAILQALYARERSGKGASIEIAMFDCLADWMNVPLLHYDMQDRVSPRVGLGHAAIHPYGPYGCRDGEVVVVVQNPSEWAAFCEHVLKIETIAGDPRFADNPSRVDNKAELDAIIAECFAAMSRAEAIKRLETAGLAWAQMSELSDLSVHPALRRITAETKGRSFSMAASALAPNLPSRAVPELGAHTTSILAEFEGGDE